MQNSTLSVQNYIAEAFGSLYTENIERLTFNFKVFVRNKNIFKKYTNQPCLFSKRRFYCIIQSKLRSDWTFIGDMQKKQRPQPEVAGLSSFEAGTER